MLLYNAQLASASDRLRSELLQFLPTTDGSREWTMEPGQSLQSAVYGFLKSFMHLNKNMSRAGPSSCHSAPTKRRRLGGRVRERL